MDEVSNSSPSVDTPNPKLRKRNAWQLFKDSWRSFSKTQKSQLVAVLVLVLALPALLGGVYVAKIYRSGAATPPGPYTPSPTPTPNPIGFPVINTTSLPQIYWNIPYTATIDAYETTASGSAYTVNALNMSISTLPSGLTLNNCKRYSSAKNHTSIISCTLSGIPATADLNWVDGGFMSTAITVSNSSVSTTNQIRVPIWTVSTTTPTPTPTPSSTPPPQCSKPCNMNSDCASNFVCYQIGGGTSANGVITGYCRNPSCLGMANCICPTPVPTKTPTPTPKSSVMPTPIFSIRPSATPTFRPTPVPTPTPCRVSFFGFCLIR